MTGRFAGKVAIVTGAASGIGAATARRLAAEGAAVMVADLQAEAGTALAAEIGGGATFQPVDVAEEADWAAANEAVRARYGRLDVVAHCAGIAGFGTVEDTSVATWRKVFDVNALGTFLACRFGVEMMKDAGGAIVAVASTASLRAVPGQISYSASKAAVLHIVRCTAIEAGRQGYRIRCNAVMPGLVDTAMATILEERLGSRMAMEEAAARIHPIGRMAQPAEIAATIAFLASDDASFVTAAAYAVDGGKIEV